ncbi:hypothetical protein RMATCC62417_09731 [Rhizopus microsporus]|nr:hypothetical protein RMATCC62417_09731 [Rhizopus microsporus]
MTDNVRRTEAVCVIPMDDAKNSLLNREWKQLMRAVYQQEWFNKPCQEIQIKKDTTAPSDGDIKEGGGMKQEEVSAQEKVGIQEEVGTQEEVGAQEQAHISRALGFIEFTPRQLPPITADGVRCLRSQSAPNLR